MGRGKGDSGSKRPHFPRKTFAKTGFSVRAESGCPKQALPCNFSNTGSHATKLI
jgi:hypothetical protein